MNKLIFALALLGPAIASAERFAPAPALPYEAFAERHHPVLLDAILSHVSPADALAGTIIASPERGIPDYYFHWVRDAALTMITLGEAGHRGHLKAPYVERLFKEYAALSRLHQDNTSDVGKAKFYVDTGRPYQGPWCDPQYDGPALRAIALTDFALAQLARGNVAYVRERLYDGRLPSDAVIKRDLEAVAHHWRRPSCDLWEETWGDHFYTRMVQRKALVKGAELAERLGDRGAARHYRAEAAALAGALERHWDPSIGFIRATLNHGGGVHKEHDLDTAVVLGVLHGHLGDGVFDLRDPRVRASVEKMAQVFKDLYPLNQTGPGIAIGRYKEDTWNKVRGVEGNPWYLLTAAFAQYYFRASREITDDRDEARRLFELGDSYLRRIHHHAREGGYRVLDEQFDRHHGRMTSAPDLTWSYAEVLEAKWARAEALAHLDAASCRRHLEVVD